MTLSKTWGTTASERRLAFPCDANHPDAQDRYFRGISIHAPPEVVFRWLCQLQAGAYSYDPFSRFAKSGKEFPPELTPGLDVLGRGKIFMDGFVLVDFERDRHITIKTDSGRNLIGDILVSYLIIPMPNGWTRLLVKVSLRYPAGPIGWIMRVLLPWGDLIMMRKQLLNFKEYSEAPRNPPGARRDGNAD